MNGFYDIGAPGFRNMLHVIIADDHPVVLRGLEDIIREGFDNVVVEKSSRGYELLNKINNGDFDIALFDIALPDIHGLEVLKEIKQKKRIPVLVLSVYPEENYATRALRAGASGFLTKQSTPDEILQAIRTVLSGKKYVSPVFAEKIVHDFAVDSERLPHESLSDRELQILSMIGTGKAMKEIAADLHLSTNTVRTYRARILDKIGVKGTNKLIHYAITHNIADNSYAQSDIRNSPV
ncbi:MAG TPA: response regulator transcription factor [Syntrophorhabdaceae bacterium]|nr:response regulator transcription factor [Syntrophorhabdaceae bacterium]